MKQQTRQVDEVGQCVLRVFCLFQELKRQKMNASGSDELEGDAPPPAEKAPGGETEPEVILA